MNRQSYKAPLIVIYVSKVVNISKITSKYDSLIVIYALKRFIRFATSKDNSWEIIFPIYCALANEVWHLW